VWPRLQQHLQQHADVAFTWHGVGCDDCGMYPIVGRRCAARGGRCLDVSTVWCAAHALRSAVWAGSWCHGTRILITCLAYVKATAVGMFMQFDAKLATTIYHRACDPRRRYQCLDCPETIGYDLCGACYERGTAGRGRFNQRHTCDHQLRKLEASLSLRDVGDPYQGSALINLLQVR
jgi:hypothetical protein